MSAVLGSQESIDVQKQGIATVVSRRVTARPASMTADLAAAAAAAAAVDAAAV
jgi:hypothetical protein